MTERGHGLATERGSSKMSQVTYEVIQHDGGWAYKMGGTISETYPTHQQAHAAAALAAGEQEVPGESGAIEYEDSAGKWREEQVTGGDRPGTDVKDET